MNFSDAQKKRTARFPGNTLMPARANTALAAIIAERRARVKEIAEKLAALEQEATLEIDLPEAPADRRETYRRIAGQAHRLFGPGNYEVCAKCGKMTVLRGVGRTAAAKRAWAAKCGRNA
jgi:hypothetical protein